MRVTTVSLFIFKLIFIESQYAIFIINHQLHSYFKASAIDTTAAIITIIVYFLVSNLIIYSHLNTHDSLLKWVKYY